MQEFVKEDILEELQKKKRGKKNKKAISSMISYVLLISITLSLSIVVYIWIQPYFEIKPKINCESETSLALLNYRCEMGGNLYLDVENNGMFSIDGFILTTSNSTKRMPIDLLNPSPTTGFPPGNYYFRQEVHRVDDPPIPVSMWNFEGNTDDLKDINPGVFCNQTNCGISASYESGEIRQAINFSGIGYVKVKDDPTLELKQKFSISAWIKTTKSSQMILFKENVTGAIPPYAINMSGGKISCYGTSDGTALRGITTPVGPALDNDAWHYVVCTYNQTDWEVYIDLTGYGSVHDAAGNLLDSTGNLIIGGRLNGGDSFTGLIEQAAIYKRAMTQEEMKNIYYNSQRLNPGETRNNIWFGMKASEDIQVIQIQPFIWDDRLGKGVYEKILCENAVIRHEVYCPFTGGGGWGSGGGGGGGCFDTCASLGYECNTWTICGSSHNCGPCLGGKICSAGKCIIGGGGGGGCTDTCASLGYECNSWSICGSSQDCGPCLGGKICASGKCILNCTNYTMCDAPGLFCDAQMLYNCTFGIDGCLDRTNLTICSTGFNCAAQSGCVPINYINSCQILNQSNKIYVINQSIVNNTIATSCINITAQNITLDCMGHSISTSSGVAGIKGIYSNSSRTTIKNCNIYGFSLGYAIYLKNSNNSNMLNNSLHENNAGISLDSSSYDLLDRNIVRNNSWNGVVISYSSDNSTLINNIINDNNGYGVAMSSSYNTLINNTLNHNLDGIRLINSNNTLDRNNVYNNNRNGIFLDTANSDLNNLTNNHIRNNSDIGIYISGGSNNFLKNNILELNFWGIELGLNSNSNYITENTVYGNNEYGIYIPWGSYNNFTNNIISYNGRHGIFLSGSVSDNTLIMNNSIINNIAIHNLHGIVISSSSYNKINNNTASDNSASGIYVSGTVSSPSNNNTLIGNFAERNSQAGIEIVQSTNNTLLNNTVKNNSQWGFTVFNSNKTYLIGNTAKNNSYGFYSTYSSSSSLIGNIFCSNTVNDLYCFSASPATFANDQCSTNQNCGGACIACGFPTFGLSQGIADFLKSLLADLKNFSNHPL